VKSVLITGGTGFIGSHLVDELLEKQYKIYCIVRNFNRLKWLANKPVEFIKYELGTPDIVLPDVDYVYHLAALTKARKIKEFYKVNYYGTVNLLKIISKQKKPPKSFFLLSTLAVNGKRDTDICIKEEISPESHYAKSKWLAEQEVLKYKELMNIIIIRPTAVYGPRDKELLNYFKMIDKFKIALILNKNGVYSFLYIKDLINMLLLLLECNNIPNGQVFLISDGNKYEWSEIIKKISSILGIAARTVVMPRLFTYFFAIIMTLFNRLKREPFILTIDKLKEIFKKGWFCDIKEVREILHFDPKYDIDRGLQLTFDWYKKNGWL
jgi:nucleoside-diphosphate-sugar epimerase